MCPNPMTAWTPRALGLVLALAAVASNASESKAGPSTVTIECGIPDRHPKVVDTSRCFVGDLCCCRYDAFDLADLLLSEEETVISGRIEEVVGLPETLLVRHDVQATVAVHKVFRSGASPPARTIQVRLSSDMFVWPEAGVSRILARQAMVNEHERQERSILERRRLLDAELASGELDEEGYGKATAQLRAERKRLGQLRWDWEGEMGVFTRSRQDPFPNCDNGVFTMDRDGSLEVGGTYLFALEQATVDTEGEYRLSDDARWNVFSGDEMADIVHALTYTNACLSWPEIVYGPENEFVVINICATWARGSTRPHEVTRRR